MPVDTPLSHRIEGEAAESATGDFAPIIETAGAAHRGGRRPGRASLRRRTPQPGQKPAKDDGSRRFPGSKCVYRVRQPPPARVRNGLEPRRAWNRIDPAGDIESISRDFDLAREANTRRTPPEAGSC